MYYHHHLARNVVGVECAVFITKADDILYLFLFQTLLGISSCALLFNRGGTLNQTPVFLLKVFSLVKPQKYCVKTLQTKHSAQQRQNGVGVGVAKVVLSSDKHFGWKLRMPLS